MADRDRWDDGPSSYVFSEDAEGDFCRDGCEGEEADNYSELEGGGTFLCDVEGEYGLGCLGCEEEGYGRCC